MPDPSVLQDSRSVPFETVQNVVRRISERYERLKYSELYALAKTEAGPWTVIDHVENGYRLQLTIQVNAFGLLRPRVSVEIVPSAAQMKQWPFVPCFYMERFASGRLLGGSTWPTSRASVRWHTCFAYTIFIVIPLLSVILLLVYFARKGG